jgi:hypothetical protein
MIAPPYKILERLTIVAPFGIGLWDPMAARLVSEEMRVRVFRTARPYTRDFVEAVPGRNAVFVPHDLFGARRFDDRSAGDTASPPETVLVEVRDLLGRYASFVMHVAGGRDDGFAVPACVGDVEWPGVDTMSPDDSGPYVPLFALPSRPIPAGMTAVRGSLRDAATGNAAEGAVLEVREAGRLLARGLADPRGEVAAVFAYPEVGTPLPWSPPGTAPKPLRMTDQRWLLDVAVRYRRDVPRVTPGGSRPPLSDICDVLHQPIARLSLASPGETTGRTPMTSLPGVSAGIELRYGEEPVLPELLIDPV